ncbi:MAG TPA: alpha/beta family hydrolase [Steroidobacteraceae bacterium]|nr:alpha/beta family hydrolase [Steroidobacteraceae bacterium]
MARGCETVVFSHGKESGPWGDKITAMAAAARDLGCAVESLDYRDIADPRARVDRLIAAGRAAVGPLVLAGSSLGGHVSAAAARTLGARGLFLLAPAFYMPGFEAHTPHDPGCPAAIVHGWRDEIVSVENSIRWARERRAELHLVDSDHRLQDRITQIVRIFRAFLESLA